MHETMLHSRDELMVIEDYGGVQPGFNEQYEEMQKNLVFTPSNTVLWFECHFCKRKSATEERLERHIAEKHSGNQTEKHAESVERPNTEPFKCSICSFSCSTNADLMRHSKKHKGIKPYSCKICNRTFSQKGNLKPHMLRHSDESPYQCNICPKAFNHKSSYKKHMEEHTTPKNFPCRHCNKQSFATEQLRTQHEQNKHPKDDVDCIICGVILNSTLGLKMHIAQMHPNVPGASQFTAEKKWACQYCNKKFSTKTYLIVHHKIHRGEKPFKCEECDYRAVSRDSVKKHAERSHGQMKPLKCNICPRTFMYYSHKKSHMLRHYNLKPFSCHLCNRSFQLKRHLTDHIRLHEGKPKYKCEQCDVAYVLPDSLRKHKDLHLSSPLICHICEKQFYVTGRYNKHMTMHRREYSGKPMNVSKPFKCHLCSKAFKVKRFLTKHLLNGCADVNNHFECTECCEVLASEQLMKQHMKALHNLKEYCCFVCADAFKRIHHLFEHIEKEHPNESVKDARIMQATIRKDFTNKGMLSSTSKDAGSSFGTLQENTEIRLVECDDTELANNVLVINEVDMSIRTEDSTQPQQTIKIEEGDVNYQCTICGTICCSYDEIVEHQLGHEQDFTNFSEVKNESKESSTTVVDEQQQLDDKILDTIHIDLDKIDNLEHQLKREVVEEYHEAEEGSDEDETVTCYECRSCGLRYPTYEECEDHYNAVHMSSNKKYGKNRTGKRKTLDAH
uniref:Zinc finger protein 260-like n=1 Tax=Hirondellea gigas TaxID=1518452 RepID=A0A2P2I7S5_9CRUS